MVGKKESEWERYRRLNREQAANFPNTKVGKAFKKQLDNGGGSFRF